MPMSFIKSKNVEHSSEKTPREFLGRFTNIIGDDLLLNFGAKFQR